MQPFFHSYVLPALFFLVHVLVSLPALLPSTTHVDDPLTIPPLHARLQLRYAIPLGAGAFIIVHIIRQLASHFPLPRQRRRRRLAHCLEWILLFALGLVEELLRYGVVRFLIFLEGGHGGCAGSITRLTPNGGYLSPSWGDSRPSREELWGGVYMMSWTWCLLETFYAWRSLRPSLEEGGPSRQIDSARSTPRPGVVGYGTFRNPVPLPRSLSGSGHEPSSLSRSAPPSRPVSRDSSSQQQALFSDFFDEGPSHKRHSSTGGDRRPPLLYAASSDGDDEGSSVADDASDSSSSWSEPSPRAGDLESASEAQPLLETGASSSPRRSRSPSPDAASVRPSHLSWWWSTLRALGACCLYSGHVVFRRMYAVNPSKSIFSVRLESLHPLYPIVWRMTSLLTHVAYGLLYALFPSIVLRARNGLQLEWFSLGLLLLLALVKGSSTVFWFGGRVARWGMAQITTLCLSTALVTWWFALVAWGIIEVPWDWSG